MHIKVEIEVPPELLAKPDIVRLAQQFVVLFCARLLEASADMANGKPDPGTGDTTGR